MNNRLSWEEYALMLAKTAAQRSEDPYKKVGSCILRHDKSVCSVGYNGAPRGITIDWSNRDERRKRVIHSEINALAYCKPGEGWLIACTLLPCRSCLQAIAAHGIKVVVFEEIYDQDDFALRLAHEYKIELMKITI
jgi:dCMP deaminase